MHLRRSPARSRRACLSILSFFGFVAAAAFYPTAAAAQKIVPPGRFLYENLPAKLDPVAYREFALDKPGKPASGRRLFADLKGVACINCHSVAGEGGKVGPDLAGIAAKYPRDELIRSVLEPSNRIADGYQMTI